MKAAPGFVAKPYGMEDLQGRLAQLSGDAAFAREFFAKYLQGHDVPDYGRLLGRMGLLMRKKAAGKGWLGSAPLVSANGGLRVGVVPFESPLYKAGMAQDDQLVTLDGVDVTSTQAVLDVVAKHAARGHADAEVRAPQRRHGERPRDARGRPARRDRAGRNDGRGRDARSSAACARAGSPRAG